MVWQAKWYIIRRFITFKWRRDNFKDVLKLLQYEKSAYFTHRNECSAQLMIPTNLSIFLKTLHFNSHPTMRRWIHATGYGTALFLWENVFSTVHIKDCMEGATLCRMHWKLRQKLQIFILSGFSLAIFIWILIKLNNINFYGAVASGLERRFQF